MSTPRATLEPAKGAFTRALAEARAAASGAGSSAEGASVTRRWIFVAYDQLTFDAGPITEQPPHETGLVLVECPAKAARRPYHKQKLALVLANLRCFAVEAARRGFDVRHVVAESYAEGLERVAGDVGPLVMMEAAERELRVDVAPLVARGLLSVVPHAGWLTTPEDFERSQDGPPWRMDKFYRHVRQRTGWLMSKGKPIGGKYSFDAENRRPWRGEPGAPVFPHFPDNPIKSEVVALVESRFSSHPGELDARTIPSTIEDAERLWAFALTHCLPHFGPYEDAMSTKSSTLFHSCTSPLLNLHRLLPRRVVEDVLAREELPLASREGFLRQIAGWRELVRHVHRATDGFRVNVPLLGDGVPGAPSALGAHAPLPPAFWWTAKTGLACLDHVLDDVWREGYSHHITRLMVLSNVATLLDVEPRALTDWFWAAYRDAYDWVVEPNVLAMGTFGAGDVMTTKPYVAGSGYVERMSDYCDACALHPKKTCPLPRLYWAFLARHHDVLRGATRMDPVLAAVRKRSDDDKARDRAVFVHVSERLRRGLPVLPDDHSA
ncbi:cryptochrome/photolyase family protein [Myxococcota bacterium]|nr:cryptochrome/photolyase family protein [Myxococcota bacterium]